MSAIVTANIEPVDPGKIENSSWKVAWLNQLDVFAFNMTFKFDNKNHIILPGGLTSTWTINQLHDKAINFQFPSPTFDGVLHFFDNYEMFCVMSSNETRLLGQRIS
jgi:hypothetical protein